MYTRTLLVTLSLLSIGCGPSAVPPSSGGAEGEAMAAGASTTCTPSYDTTFTPGTTFDDVTPEDVVAWPTPGVTFAATVVRLGDTLRIEGALTNGTDAAVTVDYLTGGVMGLSTNPFQVDIDVLPVTASGPEVYPTPRRVVLPAGGNVTFRTDRCPTFPARVHWVFSPWRGDAVQGDVAVP